MPNTSKQDQDAARDHRAWSTAATNGSVNRTPSDVLDASAAEIKDSSSSADTSFAIQRWLAEKPHEGPWNGMAVSSRPNKQVGKKD